MKVLPAGERYDVIDDFLPGEALAALRSYAAQRTFLRVESVVDARIDGAAQRSRGGLLRAGEQLPGPGLGPAARDVMDAARSRPHLYGESPHDWDTMSFAFWRYEAGTRLGWHNDAGNGRTGEYILYIHDVWRPSWGGELMIVDESSPAGSEGLSMRERSAVLEDTVASSSSMITAIYPRPNRLVMLKAGTSHYINRVDRAAGTSERCSMTGFMSRAIKSARDVDQVSLLTKVLDWQEAESTQQCQSNGTAFT